MRKGLRQLLRNGVGVALLLTIGAVEALAGGEMFRCERQGERVFVDRIIDGATCEAMSVSMSNRADSVEIRAPSTSASKPSHRKSTKSSHDDSVALDQVKHQQQCDRMRLRLSEIDNKFRAGYTLQQGERLKERKRVLNEQLKIEGCR